MSMIQIYESTDKLMNRLDDKYYSRLLATLSMLVYELSNEETAELAVLRAEKENTTEEEKAIIAYFVENPNNRPGILASCYSRVITHHFRINYSI